ncbi:MAG: glycogen debranching enzyme GlgX, partial [Reinekea forsetii]|nr:glycogen debranching enzyme GlgX [Reinekea forsetii]
DNDISWYQWDERDIQLETFTRQVIALRKSSSLFSDMVLKGQLNFQSPFSSDEVHWYRPDGYVMEIKDWHDPKTQSFAMLLSSDIKNPAVNLHLCDEYYLVIFNASAADMEFTLPANPISGWVTLCDTARNNGLLPEEPPIVKGAYLLLAQSVVVLGKAYSS